MDSGPAPVVRPGMTRPSMSIRPAFCLLPRRVGALPIALPSAGRSNAIDAGGAADFFRRGGIEHHHRLATLAGLIDRLPQQAAVGADGLIGRAQMLLRAILDGG